MTTPGTTAGAGYVTNEVISIQLRHLGDTIDVLRTHIVGELQLLRAESVRRDVYDEQRRADRVEAAEQRRNDHNEMEAMKKRLETAENRKWMLWVAVATAIFALGKDIILTAVQ